jgi:hypothetical protein
MSRVHPESQPLTRRTVVAGAVTGLHAVFAVGLLVSTAIHLGATPPPSIRLVDIKPDDVVQPKVPPPPPFGFKPGDVTAPPDPDIRVIGPDGGQTIVVAGAMPVVPVHAQPQAEPAAVTAIAPSPMPDQPATPAPRPAARGDATAVPACSRNSSAPAPSTPRSPPRSCLASPALLRRCC